MRAHHTPWPLVGLLVAAGVVAAFHVGKAPPALPSIRADLDASLRQAGWLLSIINLVTAALVSAGGWPAAAWMTSIALVIAAAAGVFLHWRERRRIAA